VRFDALQPLQTPRELDVSAPFLASALADAVRELSTAGVPLDAPLGDFQFVTRDGLHLPLGGGGDELAVVNLMTAPFTADGFAEPFYGSGYLHVVAFDGSPCPDAATLLAYSQASDPASPHHADQTELFSSKRWVQSRFCEADILASPALEQVLLRVEE
jgi:acyl-homoserine-lactone acylase